MSEQVIRLLVLVQGYPSPQDRYNLAYVHTRLLGYLAAGLQVRVLNFGASASYRFEGVEVLREADWRPIAGELLVSHAPNLRNHLRFLLRHGGRFRRWLLFFHGHEVLSKARHYPAPYDFSPRSGRVYRFADQAYDRLKLAAWTKLLTRWLPSGRVRLVFVSEWMREAMLAGLRIDPALVGAWSEIIPNPVHPLFLALPWRQQPPLEADFVTIRPLDNPKYGVDIVSELARAHPQLRFDVYGRGRYFAQHPPPPNLRWIDRYLSPELMINLLPRYRAALMPTRLDAQGVMMCELASFGMPLITSDLPICREMLSGFPRCGFLPEDPNQAADLPGLLTRLEARSDLGNRQRFAPSATLSRELDLIRSLANDTAKAHA